MRSVSLLVCLLASAPAFAQSPVVIKALAEVVFYPERGASAQVVSLNESRIAAEIAGRIDAIPVKVGERISRGAVLARIDCRDHELAFERARAAAEAARSRLDLAEHQLGRARELGSKGFFSKDALDARVTEVEVLRADVQQASTQRNIAARAAEKCVVRSPFPAVVRERLGQVGEFAAPGTALVALTDAAAVEISARVQPEDTASLRQAKSIRFAGDGGERAVKLLRISPAIDPQARTAEARLAFTGAPAAPGAAGRIAWRDSAPHLPSEVILRRGARLGLFVEEGGVARFRPLEGAQEGRPAPVALPLDTRAVVQGQLALKEGQELGAQKPQ